MAPKNVDAQTGKIEQIKAEKIPQIRAVKIKQIPEVPHQNTSGVPVTDSEPVTALHWTRWSKTEIEDRRKAPYGILVLCAIPLLALGSKDLEMAVALSLFATLIMMFCVVADHYADQKRKVCPWCQSVNDVHALICRSCGRQPLPLQEGFDASRTTHHDHDADGDIRRGPNANHTQHRVRTGSIPIRFF